jgi:hypothetical protein
VNRIWGDMTPLAMAVGNSSNIPLIQALLDAGADPDASGRGPSQSARSIARFMLLDSVPRAPIRRDIARLLGWDPDALLAERHAALAAEVPLDVRVQQALQQAAGDAYREGAAAIAPVHLLFGVARTLSGGLLRIRGGLNAASFIASFASRLEAPDLPNAPALPLDADGDAVLAFARTLVRQQARGSLGASTLILALLEEPHVANLLAEHGAEIKTMRRELSRG